MTVRRDFHYLEDIGVADVHYGGASLRKEKMLIPSFSMRDREFNQYKQAIGRIAATYVKDGETIFLDVSSTVFHILRYLPDIHLTVITNSMPVTQQLYHEGAIKNQMRKNAEQSFLMTDHTKFTATTQILLNEFDEFNYILTDSELDDTMQEQVKKQNRNLILCNI